MKEEIKNQIKQNLIEKLIESENNPFKDSSHVLEGLLGLFPSLEYSVNYNGEININTWIALRKVKIGVDGTLYIRDMHDYTLSWDMKKIVKLISYIVENGEKPLHMVFPKINGNVSVEYQRPMNFYELISLMEFIGDEEVSYRYI